MINEKDRNLVLEFKGRLSSDIKEHLKRIIVFGSRVKGYSMEDSDLDVVALVDKKDSEVEQKLDDIIYQIMFEHDFKPIISLKIFTESHFYDALKRGFSFYNHVEKEGISL